MSPPFLTRRNVYASLACAILLAIFALTSLTALQNKSAAFDEPIHFVGAWLQTHYGDFRCNPEDPPLWKYYVAAGTRTDDLPLDRQSDQFKRMLTSIPAPEVRFVDQSLYQNAGVDADKLLQAARFRMTLLGVVLGVVIAWWAWRLGGPIAAVVSCAAFCLDPNFLAHSPLIKNDVPITLVFFLTMAFAWTLGQRVTLIRVAGLVVLVGVAVTTKFSGLLLFPALAIVLLCRVIINSPWPVFRWSISRAGPKFLAAAGIFCLSIIVAFMTIWASYGFRLNPTANSEEKFDFKILVLDCAENEMLLRQNPIPLYPTNQQYQQWVNQWKPGIIVSTVRFAEKTHLLPQSWLFGFLYTYATSLARRTFLCGDIGVAGWWYYFPAAMAFKTPLATLASLAGAAVLWLALLRKKNPNKNTWNTCAAVIFPVFYLLVAMRSHLNIGLRHVFPVYSFLFLFIGVMAAKAFSLRPKITAGILIVLLLGVAAETFAAYPNFIPFFNIAAGGSRGGLALLSDTNIDWGQDLPALAQWQHDHPDRQLYLCALELPDPRYYGLHYIQLDGNRIQHPDETVPSGLPPVYAISAVALQGPYMMPLEIKVYEKFRRQKPIAVLNGTIYLYDTAPPK